MIEPRDQTTMGADLPPTIALRIFFPARVFLQSALGRTTTASPPPFSCLRPRELRQPMSFLPPHLDQAESVRTRRSSGR